MEHVPPCVVWAQRPASVVGTWRPNRAADNARRVAFVEWRRTYKDGSKHPNS